VLCKHDNCSYFSIMSRSLLYWVIHKSIYTSLNTQSELSNRDTNRHKSHSIFVSYWLLNNNKMTLVSLTGNIFKILLQHCWNNIAKRSLRKSLQHCIAICNVEILQQCCYKFLCCMRNELTTVVKFLTFDL